MRVLPIKEFYSQLHDGEIVIRYVGNGWILVRRAADGEACYRAEYGSDVARVFKTIDSACRDLKSHGIVKARVVL